MLKLCSYNVEWMDKLFNSDNTLKNTDEAVKQLDAFANVLDQLDCDLIGITEAPNSAANGSQSAKLKLETFAAHYGLRTNRALTGFISAGKQEIALLFDPNKITASHSPGGRSNSKSNPRFDGEFYFDTDDDRIKEVYKHYRPPLEAKIKVKSTDKEFRLIVAHTKSKGIFSSVDLINLERESRRNRLKIYAECTWIRKRVDEFLDKGHNVVVMGDINDGPGMDFYEMRYGRSGVELIMGSIYKPEKLLNNHIGMPIWGKYGWTPSTVSFKDRITETYINVLIDHILTSKCIKTYGDNPYEIWNPFQNGNAKPLKQKLLDASDHFPITIKLRL